MGRTWGNKEGGGRPGLNEQDAPVIQPSREEGQGLQER